MADSTSRMGDRYSTPQILTWLNTLHAPHDTQLESVYHSPERAGLPAIQLGQAEAGFLEWLVRITRTREAVEVGTLAGYSALRIARGLVDGGHLYSLESDPAHAALARSNIELSGLTNRVTVVEGFAAATLPSIESKGPFDLVFLDADKSNYLYYGRWAHENLKTGGLLVADNVYLFGRLLDRSAEAENVRLFHLEASQKFDTACLPTPDGLLVGVKR